MSVLARPVLRGTVPAGYAVAAATLFAAAQAQVWIEPGVAGRDWAVALQCAIVTGAVAVCRSRPLVAVGACVAAGLLDFAAYRADQAPSLITGLLLAVLLISFSVARHERRTDLALAGGLVLLAVFWLPDIRQANPASEYLASFIGVGAAWAAGRVTWYERVRAERLRAALADAERQRARAEEAAAFAERSRIAREVHDIVAHSLSVVAVQADAAQAQAADEPAAAAERMGLVRDTAQDALTEMRRVLGTLREGPDAGGPQPSIADLPALIAAHGARVDLAVEGEQRPLPPAVDVSAFRIVQEGLSNARRHAPGARARVEVGYHPSALRIAVANEGGPVAVGDGAGHGLIGVRERVHALGGELSVGPATSGGWRLEALLPLERR